MRRCRRSCRRIALFEVSEEGCCVDDGTACLTYIAIENEITNEKFPISLKAYGDGSPQLSTDKSFQMYPLLEGIGELINDKTKIASVF